MFEHGARSKGTDETYELLSECGYDICDIDGGGPYTLAALHDRLEPRTIWNLLAIPR